MLLPTTHMCIATFTAALNAYIFLSLSLTYTHAHTHTNTHTHTHTHTHTLTHSLTHTHTHTHRMNSSEEADLFNFTMTYDNETDNETFNCLSSNISRSHVTDRMFWEITLQEGSIAVAVVFAIYFLLAFGWNFFIIATFLNKRKLLREPANILLLNLAIADLTIAMTQMFFSVVTEAAEEFIFGETDVVRCGMCDFTGVFFMLLYGVSMHTLATLSLDRFLLLYKPFRYKKIMTQRNTVLLVVGIWLISSFLALPPVLGFGQIEFNTRFGSCVPRFTGKNLHSNLPNFFYIAYVTLESLFPIVTIAICSFWTYRFINKFLTRNYRRRSFYNRRGNDGVVHQRQEDSRYHHQQQQLVKVFGALLLSTLISWFPVILVIIVIGILGGKPEKVPDWVYVVGWICYLTAPVFHPIIESFFVKDMRLVVCKGVRQVNRASSFIAKSTTGMFANKDIEMANEKADSPEYVSERKIQFFGKKGNRNRLTSSISMTTEVTDIPQSSSHNNTPSPQVEKKVPAATEETDHGHVATTEVLLRDKQNGSVTSSATKPRRITFSDESPPLLLHGRDSPQATGETPTSAGGSPMTARNNGVRKSALKLPREPPSLTPVGETGGEESPSSGDGSVFNTPDSPQAMQNLIQTETEWNGGLMDSKPLAQGYGNRTTQEHLNSSETGGDSPDNDNYNGEHDSSDLNLLQTVYHSDELRRGSLTLV